MRIKRLKTSVFFILILCLIAVAFLTPGATKADKSKYAQIENVEKAIEVLTELVEIPEEGVPEALLEKAYGIAILPGVIKAAYGIGGQYGKGILVVRNEENEWSNPSFVKLVGGSYGWQIGVQKADIILVFKSPESIDGITSGKITLGADASIAAGPVGRSAEASTDIEFEAEIYSYSRSRGLFAGIAIKGGAIQIDEEANEVFYGTREYTVRDIFRKTDIKAPAVVEKLRKVLAKYTHSPQLF